MPTFINNHYHVILRLKTYVDCFKDGTIDGGHPINVPREGYGGYIVESITAVYYCGSPGLIGWVVPLLTSSHSSL